MRARFDTIPSRPISHALEKTSAHSASIRRTEQDGVRAEHLAPVLVRPVARIVALETLRHALAGRGEGPLSVALDLIEER
jgi:hypothetical protein